MIFTARPRRTNRCGPVDTFSKCAARRIVSVAAGRPPVCGDCVTFNPSDIYICICMCVASCMPIVNHLANAVTRRDAIGTTIIGTAAARREERVKYGNRSRLVNQRRATMCIQNYADCCFDSFRIGHRAPTSAADPSVEVVNGFDWKPPRTFR